MVFIVVLSCLVFSSFFAGLETGLLSADKLAIFSKKEQGKFYAAVADHLLTKPERLLGTTLIGTNMSVVTAAVSLNSYLRTFDFEWLSWVGSFGLSLVLLMFAEIIPKSFFRRHADSLTVRLAPVLGIFYILFYPVSLVLNTVIRVILILTGQYRQRLKGPQSRDDFRLMVKLGSREAGFGFSDFRVFEDIFDFRETLAKEVMLPLHDHPVCHIGRPVEELADMVVRTDTRFIPVYQDRSDNIIGYADGEDLLKQGIASIRDIVHDAVFYPGTKRIPDLLLEMNQRHLEVVFLSDEYGAVSGMVTPREIASEVVGFIPGKTPNRENVERIAQGYFTASGTTDLEHFHHETGIFLGKRNSETLGGYLCEELGHIPAVGESVTIDSTVYTILEADPRRVIKIEVAKEDRHRHQT